MSNIYFMMHIIEMSWISPKYQRNGFDLQEFVLASRRNNITHVYVKIIKPTYICMIQNYKGRQIDANSFDKFLYIIYNL